MSKQFTEAEERAIALEKEILKVYESAMKTIRLSILEFRADAKRNFGKKRPSAIKASRLKAQEDLNFLIKTQAREVRQKSTAWLKTGIAGTLKDAYYYTSFKIDQVIYKLKGGVSGFSLLPAEAVEAALSEEVAGHTFKDRTLQQQRELQYRVRTATAQAIAEGIPEVEFTKRLELLNNAAKAPLARAQATARTEVLRAYSIGHDKSTTDAEELGVIGVYKWDATLDGDTRRQHRLMDGKERAEDGFFTMPNGEKARYPRDPNLSAGQSINCRCESIFIVDGIEPSKKFSRLEKDNAAFERKGLKESERYKLWKGNLKDD